MYHRICLAYIYSSSDVQKLLVGNKCDLESERVVPYERVKQVSSASCDLTGYHGANTVGRRTEHWFY